MKPPAVVANRLAAYWLGVVGTTDGSSWYRNLEKPPREDPREHQRRSPLLYVGNVTTPALLTTGVDHLRLSVQTGFRVFAPHHRRFSVDGCRGHGGGKEAEERAKR